MLLNLKSRGEVLIGGLMICFLFIVISFIPANAKDLKVTESYFQKPLLFAEAGTKKKAEKPKLRPPELGHPEIQEEIYGGQRLEERLLNLGTKEKFEILERSLIKSQVKSFIPPLLVPAFTNHAFVLPPGLFQISISGTLANIDGDDFAKDGEVDPIHLDNSVRRRFLTTSLFYGFDLNRKFFHSFTAVLNIPYQSSINRGPVQLPDIGAGGRTVNNGGAIDGLGDVSLFIKKKIWDQANYPVGLAVAAGVFFPTGSNEEKVGVNSDGRIKVTNSTTGTTLNDNALFGRFSDDGRFPIGLQPGKGTFSYQIAGFLTRQFTPGDMPGFLEGTAFDRAAIHLGIVHRFNQEDDGIDAGDRTTLFFSGVVPVYKDYVSLQFNSVNFIQRKDSYDGLFRFPNQGALPTPTLSRKSFRGGWTNFLGPSVIFSPDPLIRITGTFLYAVGKPGLGPFPDYVSNLQASFVF